MAEKKIIKKKDGHDLLKQQNSQPLEPEKKSKPQIEVVKKIETPPVNMQKQLYWFVGILVGLFLIFFIAYYIFQGFNYFTYEGLHFEKIKQGYLTFYHTIFLTKQPDGRDVAYNMYLRTNPRENNIPIHGEINLDPRVISYLSINETGMNGADCPYNVIAVASLSQFFREAAGLEVKSASPDEYVATQTNKTYVTCENRPFNNVMLFQSANETSLTKSQGTNCYIFNIAKCDMLQAVEKFELETIKQAKNRKLNQTNSP